MLLPSPRPPLWLLLLLWLLVGLSLEASSTLLSLEASPALLSLKTSPALLPLKTSPALLSLVATSTLLPSIPSSPLLSLLELWLGEGRLGLLLAVLGVVPLALFLLRLLYLSSYHGCESEIRGKDKKR